MCSLLRDFRVLWSDCVLGPCLDTSTPAKEKACDECVCGDNDATRNCIEEFTACSGIPSDRCDDL